MNTFIHALQLCTRDIEVHSQFAMFEDSRDILLPSRGGRAPNRKVSKSQCKPPAKGRMTISIAKARKEEARTEGYVEEDTNERTKTNKEHTTIPIHEPAINVHKLNTQLQFIGPCSKSGHSFEVYD